MREQELRTLENIYNGEAGNPLPEHIDTLLWHNMISVDEGEIQLTDSGLKAISVRQFFRERPGLFERMLTKF